MKIAICDDVNEQLELIKNATYKYFSSKNEFVVVMTFNNGFDFLDSRNKNDYDLVLLDVCMPGLLGSDVARETRLANDKLEIIFLTTSNEFAVDAFMVNAVHYILKPFTEEVFNEALNRAINQIESKKKKMLYLKCPKGVIKTIDKNNINYIESNLHQQIVYLNDGSVIDIVHSLNEVYNKLEELSPNQFIIPYKGFIVNQNAISSIETDKIILKNKKSIPISRRTFNMIKDNYFKYMYGEKQ